MRNEAGVGPCLLTDTHSSSWLPEGGPFGRWLGEVWEAGIWGSNEKPQKRKFNKNKTINGEI